MAEYNNQEGWEPSEKTRNYWRFIPMSASKDIGFEMPPLFKSVNPTIKWFTVGFFGIFGLEGYATLAVAMSEGVPIEIISLLVFVDIFLAILPYLYDGARTDLKNHIFIGENSEKYLDLEADDKYQSTYVENVNKLKNLDFIRWVLYLPIVGSAIVKLWLFFGQYPFYDTYQAYIIYVSYTFGCFLHVLCTGNVIMYWRFLFKLGMDRKQFGTSKGTKRKVNKTRPDKLIQVKGGIELNTSDRGKQKILKTGDKFYFHYEGLLFDEDIAELVGDQDSLKQKMAVALTGKIIQTEFINKK